MGENKVLNRKIEIKNAQKTDLINFNSEPKEPSEE